MSSVLASPPVISDLPARILALSGKEPRRALVLARGALRSRRSGDPATRARLLRAYGHALRAVGDYRLAHAAYRRARAIFAARRLEQERAICALGLVDACMYLGKTTEALRVAAEARKFFLEIGDTTRLAKLETNVGNLFHHLEALEPALERYEIASRLFAQGGSSVERATVEHNRANILTHLGRRREAESLYASAQRVFEQASEPILAAQVRYGLACLRFLSGEYASAIAELEAVRPDLAQRGARPLLALADLDLAEVLLAMRLYPEALALSRSAGRWFEEHGVRPERARCALVAGSCLSRLGRLDEAGERLDEAERLLRDRRHGAGRAVARMARAQWCVQQGARERAAHLALEARTDFLREGFRTRALAAGALAAEIVLESGNPERARRLAESLLRSPRLPGEGYTRARLVRIQAASAARLGRVRDALRFYERAIEETRNAYASIFVDEWRVGFVEGEPAILDEALGVLLSRRPRPEPERIWEWIRPAARASSRPLPPRTEAALASRTIARRVDDLRAELEACYGRLWHMRRDVTRGSVSPLAGPWERKALRLEGQLRRWGRPGKPGPAETRSDFWTDQEAGEVRLFYFSAAGELCALRRSEDSWALFPGLAPVDEVTRLLRLFHYQMASRSSGLSLLSSHRSLLVRRANEHLAALGRLVLDPVLGGISSPRRIGISAYGPLHRLPFHALPWRGRRLVEVTQPSFLLPYAKRAPAGDRERALVLAFGERGDSIEAEASGIASQLSAGGVPTQAHLGERATRGRFLGAGGKAALLHLAGHAVYRAEHPEFSALRVADGWINATDLAGLPLEGACVVLSACETGTGGVVAGDEILGLVRGAVRGGARTIVTSLWQVDDRATARFMSELYRRWHELGRIGDAFRAAQEALARETSDPYLWAAFSLMGDDSFAWPASVSASPGKV